MAAPSFDAASSGHTASGSSLTVSHTCTGTNNLLLTVFVKVPNGTSITGVTFNSVSMTFRGSVSDPSDYDIHSYYFKSPATGAHNIVASFGSTVDAELVGMSFTGVDFTFITDLSAATTGTNATLTETSSTTAFTDEIIVGALGYNSYTVASPSFTPASSGTSRASAAQSNNNGLEGFTIPAPTKTTYTVGGTLSGSGTGALQLHYISLVSIQNNNALFFSGD